MSGSPNTNEMRLALLAIFSAFPQVPASICGQLLDEAVANTGKLSSDLLDLGGEAAAARFGAARLLASLCGACRACERGRTGESAQPVMLLNPRKAA